MCYMERDEFLGEKKSLKYSREKKKNPCFSNQIYPLVFAPFLQYFLSSDWQRRSLEEGHTHATPLPFLTSDLLSVRHCQLSLQLNK